MNIIILNSNSAPITGGQVYDSLLYKTIQNISSLEIEFCESRTYPSGINFTKLIVPFIELKMFRRIKGKKACFCSSSLAYRNLILLIMVRVFLPRVKVYVIHHHYQHEVLSGLKGRLFRFFELLFLKISTSIIIPSPYVLERTKQLLPKKTVNYIEICFAENEDSSQIKNIPNREFLYIGTIEPRKGLHLMLDSFFLLKKDIQDFIINIVGSIVDNEYYLKLLEKVELYGLEKQVVFHGRVSSEILRNLLRTAELFVFPSLLEGYGMVLIEAMSYGIPVIAFNNSAMPFTIKDGTNGFLAKNEDAKDFERLIEKVICNPSLRNHLSEGALKTYYNSRRETDFIIDVKEFVSMI